MPVRRRTEKRNRSGDAWTEIFIHGFDMLNRGYAAGIELNERLEPNLHEARVAWSRHGVEFMAGYRGNDVPWALEEFGEPGGGADAYTQAR
ncbi:hypothetical protein KEU06_13735 [Pseudaminobacter sp. 19-2017]|uniref:Uncharacterized protein n=1 Tax=Pseudaminobacter soli (ex Zhang et al. 2022) TaxID=2831468 RepID=A0A942I3B0_9HYPH|nr:hypothetical protein [Pseudaminobacter soli]MBS3649669.1 hypothetical protein [Pseudaminobacter soli]